jgi:mono/diheme cytochrome c family protein
MLLSNIHRALAAALLSVVLPTFAQDIVPAPATQPLRDQLVADMDNATTIWDNACSACHGEMGQGGYDGVPDIRNSALSLSQIMLVVNAGRKTMPAFAGFTQQELLDISTYVIEEL